MADAIGALIELGFDIWSWCLGGKEERVPPEPGSDPRLPLPEVDHEERGSPPEEVGR